MPDTPIHDIARARVGRLLNDKWHLDSLLGVGGTAAVYAATHRNGARVAIKILHPTVSASSEARIRFKREGYIVNRVDHPGVVHVLDDDIDETDGSAFIVMERAEGVSLCDRIQRRLLDESEVLEVAEQLLAILATAHEKGVIHRDLKPDNLLVDEAGRVRLLDFGIARLLDEDMHLTRTGFTFGTPAYMAPEQALGKKALIGPRTDIYAVGATMFTMMTGEYVQEGENSQALLIKVATQPARSLADVRPDSSPELVDLVDRATMMDPEDRWASATAMLERVRRVMRDRRLDASRRHISSRISAMVLPLLPSSEDAPLADEAEPLALTRERGGDRSSVIRGEHGIARPAMETTRRASIADRSRLDVLPPRRRLARAWALVPVAAVLTLVATVGWTRPSAAPATAQRATVANASDVSIASAAQVTTATAAPPPPTTTAAATTAPVSSAAPAQGTASAPAPKKPAPKRRHRKIDVGY